MKANEAASFRTYDTYPAELAIGPRHKQPCSDDAVLTVRHATTGDGRSFLLSRTQARELHEWLSRWLAEGWNGVRWEEGPTGMDVIAHFRDLAVRARVELDHAHTDHARALDAALALIPAELRSAPLEVIAKQQAEMWARMQAENEALENFRLATVGLLMDLIQHARGSVAVDDLRPALRKFLDRHNHPQAKMPDPIPEAPIYDQGQLDLFEAA